MLQYIYRSNTTIPAAAAEVMHFCRYFFQAILSVFRFLQKPPPSLLLKSYKLIYFCHYMACVLESVEISWDNIQNKLILFLTVATICHCFKTKKSLPVPLLLNILTQLVVLVHWVHFFPILACHLHLLCHLPRCRLSQR